MPWEQPLGLFFFLHQSKEIAPAPPDPLLPLHAQHHLPSPPIPPYCGSQLLKGWEELQSLACPDPSLAGNVRGDSTGRRNPPIATATTVFN